MPLNLTTFYLGRSKMLAFLSELEEIKEPEAVSIYIQSGASLSEIEDSLTGVKGQVIPKGLIETVAGSKNGAVIFWGKERKCLILPPFPLREKVFFGGYKTTLLLRLLVSDFRIALVLVHLGTYAVGVCQGEKLISAEAGTGLVHGRHKKGGSSQQRFQRRRQNQANEFLDRVCFHIKEQLEPEMKKLDYIVYGGPHHTVLQLQKRCPVLQSLDDRRLPSMEVPPVRRKVLDTTVSRVWSSCVIEWQSEGS